MEKNDAIDLALGGRVAVYRAFHAVFGGEPTAKLLDALAGEELAQLVGTFAQEAGPQLAALRAVAADLAQQGDAALDALGSAYNRLFVGPGAPEAAPWESVYAGTGNDVSLFGCVTLDARRAYVAQGFIPQGYPNVSDDHLAIELDFVRLLGERALECRAQADATGLAGALTASAEFLRGHVLGWVDGFAAALAAARHGALYREAAAVLAAFAAADAQLVDELLAAVGA